MFSPESYLIATELFIRLLGVIYFFAFGAFLFQIRGLIGDQGILPIQNFLNLYKMRLGKWRFYHIPSLFWLNATDTALMVIPAMGTALSVLLILGIWPPVVLVLLYILHLSILSTGQDFLSFGWEMFLCEITVHAFLLSLTPIPNLMVWISLNFLIFRFHIQSGAVKFQSGDPSWRSLTGLCYHYQTQPNPSALAWYMHKLPIWFHKFSTGMMFFIELMIPFLIFGTESFRLVAFVFFFGRNDVKAETPVLRPPHAKS